MTATLTILGWHLDECFVMIKMTSIIDVVTMKRFLIETLHNNKCQIPSIFRATITLYPIGRPVRATITLYPIGRPVRATITLYPIVRPVRATITLYPIGRPVRATITLYPKGIIPIDAHLV